MARRYKVTFYVEVELTMEETVMERALSPDFPYGDMDEATTVEMLGRCMGIYDMPIDVLDGWGDFDQDTAFVRRTEIDMEEYVRLPDVD